MTFALEPILNMARESGTHILLVHHSGKAERDDPADSILGSTALLGNVDTAILLSRRDEYRTILTRQRYGVDIEESILEFDPNQRSMSLGATRQLAEQDKLAREILAFLSKNPKSREADILESVVGRRQTKVAALRRLIGNGVERTGRGGKSDPYTYSCFPEPEGESGTRTANGPKTQENPAKVLVPTAETPTRNKGNKNLDVPRASTWKVPKSRFREFEELAAILEVDGELSRKEAERRAKEGMRKEYEN
jgi:hypothetical protein